MKKYEPSNGTEGCWFTGLFCDNCEHERAYRNNPEKAAGCKILTNTFLFSTNDKYYPGEWTFDKDDKPTCTSFVKEVTPEERKELINKKAREAMEKAGQMRLFT